MTDRSHLSIGEVLSLLQQEFPDITISKIRFLESQGLLDPERTPSGYRKFYEADIEKLRWILQQQRENFLPLKVIKDRLDENGGQVPPPENGAQVPPPEESAPTDSEPEPHEEAPAEPEPEETVPVWMADHAKRRATDPGTAAGAPRLDAGPTTVSLTLEGLLAASGLTGGQARALEQFGLLHNQQVGPDLLYGPEALVIAEKAAAFFRHGVEPRHLRMFKVSAEREAGLLEQIVMPMLKQRNPRAREQAVRTLEELSGLGETLHAALLRQLLDGYLST